MSAGAASRSHDIDLSRPRRIHVLGIGGTGMSPIATILHRLGHVVSGSDLTMGPTARRLADSGVAVTVGHHASNVGEVELVARSSAVGDDNPEVIAARERGIPVVSRAAVLRAITGLRRTVAVAGTHGKTTTTAMLTVAATGAGLDPSVVVGADPNELGAGAAWGDDDLLVVEADESDGTFVELVAAAGVVTSIEPDHLNHYADLAELEAGFDRFVEGVSGPVVVCLDDDGARRLAIRHGGRAGLVTYGEHPEAAVRIDGYTPVASGSRSRLVFSEAVRRYRPEMPLSLDLELRVPGRHNVRNAAAAAAVALALGAGAEGVAAGLERYTGVARRFEHRGAAAGVTFVDDYAHLPTEVEVTLEAAAAGGWDRVVCVFQPHRYTRTAALWHTFADAFTGADLLVVCDVYASGESPVPGVTGKLVLDAVLGAHPWQRVAWMPSLDDVVGFLGGELRSGDLCLTLGAGDLTTVPERVIALLGGPDAPTEPTDD